MIEAILHPAIASFETRDDLDEPLFEGEEEPVARAVEKRRLEYVTGRACARRALAQLGVAPAALLRGEKREPLWPAGIAGAITHCDGYRAAAVARTSEIASLGIDAEPDVPLPDGVLRGVASPGERAGIAASAAAAGANLDKVLFSAKEAIYKAWFPLTGRWLGFTDVELAIGADGTFRAELLVEGPTVDGQRLTAFEGRWMTSDGIILTSSVVPR